MFLRRLNHSYYVTATSYLLKLLNNMRRKIFKCKLCLILVHYILYYKILYQNKLKKILNTKSKFIQGKILLEVDHI